MKVQLPIFHSRQKPVQVISAPLFLTFFRLLTGLCKVLLKQTVVEKNAVKHTINERQILKQIDHPFLVSLKVRIHLPFF